LGSGYTVKATVGHVRDLPQRKLGVDVENGFTPEYVTIKEKAKTLAEIKKAAKASERVLLATDPDREGEAIAWHVASQLGNGGGGKVRRVLFHEITKDAVAHALANPLAIDQRKVDAQQARRRRDAPARWNRKPTSSWAYRPPSRGGSPSSCTKGSRSGPRARWGSSRTCAPPRCAWLIRPSPRRASTSARNTASATCQTPL